MSWTAIFEIADSLSNSNKLAGTSIFDDIKEFITDAHVQLIYG
jgi:hypothetical protein